MGKGRVRVRELDSEVNVQNVDVVNPLTPKVLFIGK